MTHGNVWDRIAGHDPDLRAADADRERIAERLRTSHAEGRLELAEFQERLDHCYEAKTLGELGALVRDLPRHDEHNDRRSFRWLRLWRLAPWAPIAITLIVVAAATGGHVFWLWIPLLFLLSRMSWWRRRRWAGARGGWDDWI
jgi:hypothetical protein